MATKVRFPFKNNLINFRFLENIDLTLRTISWDPWMASNQLKGSPESHFRNGLRAIEIVLIKPFFCS